MKKYSIIILTIVIALISQSILAYPLLSKDRLKDQIKGYAEQNMLPKLLEWKSTLDKGLSTDDLSTLNALREQAAALKISRIQLTKDIVSAKDIEDEETSEMLKKIKNTLIRRYKIMVHPSKGRKHTPAFLRFLSKLNSGKNNPMYGKKLSKEARKKMSIAKYKHWRKVKAA